MKTEMIEQVARAIADSEGDIICGEWAGDATKRYYTKLAKAAIMAMREPTEAMDEAARKKCHEVQCVDPVIHIWDVMLDEALRED
jgi:hypothetical protein